jgi:protoheme IX farnesyltransferase
MESIKEYYVLLKGGLVLGNLITVVAGFLLAGKGQPINFLLLFATIGGIYFVMASGCVFNNYIDRDIDAIMERTKNRALVERRISPRAALFFASILGVAGFFMLALFTNPLTVLMAAVGFFFYVVMYSLWLKRRSVYGTLIGAVSGAIPPVVGYCAAGNRFDMGAVILFLIMVSWQMPHFFAIGIRRVEDYAAARIPIMPVSAGIVRTKVSMLIYIVEFIVASSLLTIYGYVGFGYLAVALILGFAWLALGITGFRFSGQKADALWARNMFLFSLAVMMVLFITIGVGAVA